MLGEDSNLNGRPGSKSWPGTPIEIPPRNKSDEDSENCSESRLGMYPRNIRPIRAKENRKRNLMTFGTIFRISLCYPTYLKIKP